MYFTNLYTYISVYVLVCFDMYITMGLYNITNDVVNLKLFLII